MSAALDLSRLGASDAGAVILGSPRSPVDVFLRIVEGIHEPANMAMMIGTELEDLIRRQTEEQFDINIGKPESRKMGDWLRWSPDGIFEHEGKRKLFEAKAKMGGYARKLYGEPWSDQIPDHEMLQVQLYLHMEELDECLHAVAFGGDLEFFRVERNQQLGIKILNKMRRFWEDHIVTGKMPPIKVDPLDAKWDGRYPDPKQRPMVVASEQGAENLRILKQAKAAEKAAQALVKEYRAKVCEEIGEAAGITSDELSATWLRPESKPKTDWYAAFGELWNDHAGVCQANGIPPIRGRQEYVDAASQPSHRSRVLRGPKEIKR